MLPDTSKSEHWEKIYTTKKSNEVSWFEPIPDTSLSFILLFDLPRNAAIIDIGGGDSYLADYLLKLGFEDITLLDISAAAIDKVRRRLDDHAGKVKFIVSDILDFIPVRNYDLWHDRATFHFLTRKNEQLAYLQKVKKCLSPAGYLLISTFSLAGPDKCSGLPVRQYSEPGLETLLSSFFLKIRCLIKEHTTPSGAIQEFLICSFKSRTIPSP